MKRILLAVLSLFLLVAAGSSGFVFSGTAYASEEKAEGMPKISYVAMDPIILPIIDREGISQTISIVISLEVESDGMAEEVRHKLPKLADAYLSDMYGTLSKKASMEGGVIKVSMLKSRLKTVTARIMTEGQVKDVLLQVLQQHPS